MAPTWKNRACLKVDFSLISNINQSAWSNLVRVWNKDHWEFPIQTKMIQYFKMPYCIWTWRLSAGTIVQRCNDSAFLDSRLYLDSDKVFGFNSYSIFQDAHCL